MPFRAIAITVDDVPSMISRSLAVADVISLNEELVKRLSANGIPVVGFVNEGRLWSMGGKSLLSELLCKWVDSGLELGNHTFSHVSLNRVSLERWKRDVVKGETALRRILEERNLKLRYFRYPYLDMGLDLGLRRQAEAFLAARGYRNAPATIDPLDWMYARQYEWARLSRSDNLKAQVASDFLFYVARVLDYCERLSHEILGYELKQILLLHATWLTVDIIEELLHMLNGREYQLITLEEALADAAYGRDSEYVGGKGTTWLNHLAFTGKRLALSEVAETPPGWKIDYSIPGLPQPRHR